MDFQDMVPHPGEVCGSPASNKSRESGEIAENLRSGPFRFIVVVPEGHGHRNVRLCEEGHDRFPSCFLRGDDDIAGKNSEMGAFRYQHMADHPFRCSAFFRLTARPVDIGELSNSELSGGIKLKADGLRLTLFPVLRHPSTLAGRKQHERSEDKKD